MEQRGERAAAEYCGLRWSVPLPAQSSVRIRGKFMLTERQHSLEPSEDYIRLPLQVMPESFPSEHGHRKAILLCFVVILSCDTED